MKGLFLFVCIVVSCIAPFSSWAESKLKTVFVRRFDRSTVKLVRLQFSSSALHLAWVAPSGETITYKVHQLNPGLRVKLLRYATTQKPVAVGGRFQVLTRNTGVATLSFAYRVHRYWRGAQAVKFDGWMPLYTVTRLPTPPQNMSRIYELRGVIDTSMEERDNKLICVYGHWFDLLDYIHPRTQQRRGMVSQVSGIKGDSMFWFPDVYKHPRTWHEIRDWSQRLAAFRADQQRKAKGRPFVRPVIRIPLVSDQDLERFDRICQARMSALEKKFATTDIVEIEPLSTTPTPTGSAPLPSTKKAENGRASTSMPTSPRMSPFAKPTNHVLSSPTGRPTTQTSSAPPHR